jgi:hypothetical protein
MRAMRIRGHDLNIAAIISGAAIITGTALAIGASPIAAQGPSSVPWRAYGSATVSGQPAPAGATINAVSATSATTTCGTGTVSGASGNYFVDVQQIPGCLGSVTFTVNGQTVSNPPVTPPDIAGSPKQVQLQVSAATPVAPPPPPPAILATPPAPPPPPPPPAATTAPQPVTTPVVPAAPPNTGVGPGPSRATQAPPSAPAVQAPAVQAPAVGTVPQLPNTGTGGLLQSDTQSGTSPWLLGGLILAALAIVTSAVAVRRSR